jgi:GH18 family chitinase
MWKWVRGLSTVLVLALVGGAGPQPTTKPQAAAFRVVAYAPDWRFDELDLDRCRLVDELVYFSLEPAPDGTIDARRFTDAHRKRLAEIRAKFGTRVRFAIGGWQRAKHFAAVATDEKRRAVFVESIVNFCRDNEFAGVDFDWEFPKNDAEVEAYGALIAQTKAALAPHGLTVSVAVNRTQRLPKQAIEALDAVHVMAYDDGKRHATPERAQQAVEAWLAQGAPPAKLVLGVPFYGRKVVDRGEGKGMGYAKLVEKHHPASDVDEVDGFYFNGPATIERKTRGAVEQGLGGVMIWEFGDDVAPGDPASLLQAIARGRKARP